MVRIFDTQSGFPNIYGAQEGIWSILIVKMDVK
jgi:hypothetical protein